MLIIFQDAFATPYSVLIDGINHIDQLIKEIKPTIKDANEYRQENPHQFPNRARKWCSIYSEQKKSKKEE